uniref:Iodothyronine deiodinase n=1 Tax=Saimiri boliviensis boliviensis TaxID=39432 RepID=A0A2K6TUX6_SAIBB
MGILSVDLLITLQILPVFFSNCLFLALYDSVILLKHVVLLLSRSKSTRGEWRRMLTSEGLRCVWKSFLLDAYKQQNCPSGFSNDGHILLVYEAYKSRLLVYSHLDLWMSNGVIFTLNFPRQTSLCFGKNSAAEVYLVSKKEEVC